MRAHGASTRKTVNLRHIAGFLVLFIILAGLSDSDAQSWSSPVIPATNAVWQDIWVSAATGNDANSGAQSD